MELVKVSLAYMPCALGNSRIARLKNKLKAKIGWYASCNSAGHITICELEVGKDNLPDLIERLHKGLQYENAQHVYFNDFSSFNSGAYVISPTLQSKYYFNQRSAVVLACLTKNYTLQETSKYPHLTIGRKLDAEKMESAQNMMEKIDFDFFCDGVFIRVFNVDRKQYDVYSKVPFAGKIRTGFEGQLSFDF